ncbi:hypothetical protein [Pseudolabrys sp. FHR47]|uniref:hypothetical protein n=1 Tax=Pseudolabrys sp. FHR47 TaxID=2562284 RepID=UPI0010BF64C3|nr:hypothetical protein [Pseudolabrys sp. FHR47]
MAREELDNLVRAGLLKVEPAARDEFGGMVKSARRGLTDAQNGSISSDSQFDLAIEAAHKLALAALRHAGYRSENRITVFQALVHTVGVDRADLQIFLRAHNQRNLAAYEGRYDLDVKLLDDLITAAKRLAVAVGALKPPVF